MHGTYDFRKEMLQIHRENIRDMEYVPEKNQTLIDESWCIGFFKDSNRVILTGVKDLQDYLFTSLNVSLPLKKLEDKKYICRKMILVATAEQLGVDWEGEKIPASYRIKIEKSSVVICGADDRGCAQGCYLLEDKMNFCLAPYLTREEISFAPEFSPRMIHSGYEIDRFPDAHLSAIAHAGMDAILIFVKDVHMTPLGYMDFNELIYRAEKYGLDVYAYSLYHSNFHPDDPRCEEEFENNYGRLFRECPGMKGVVLVGESVGFPSKDPHTCGGTAVIDSIPVGKPHPGFYPCMDYAQWVDCLQKVVRKYRPDADIVLWTYNWGGVDKEARLKLIDALPEGITLMATFEMFQMKVVNGVRIGAWDYTLSFPEAGDYFISEAERAKERGVRLYTQANSAGRTWDFGTAPYEPFPFMWGKRYTSMLEARDKYGLCGVMESHHFGFTPSFISRLEKMMFTSPRISAEDGIMLLAEALYGKKHAQRGVQAWKKLSEGMENYVCNNEDQYGPFRIGPAYPMIYRKDVKIPTVPYAHFGGNTICYTNYSSENLFISIFTNGEGTAHAIQKMPDEIKMLEKMVDLFRQGRQMLEELALDLTGVRKEDCLRLCNLVHYLENCGKTTIHVKQWTILRWKIRAEESSEKILQMHQQMIAIGETEIANVEDTIPLVQKDSHIGYEPSMEYIGSEYHLRWKIRQVRYVLDNELARIDKLTRDLLEIEGK